MRKKTTEQPTPTPRIDEVLAKRIEELIERFPTFGYRRLWAWLRFKLKIQVSKKKVYRILKLKGWLVRQRRVTPRL